MLYPACAQNNEGEEHLEKTVEQQTSRSNRKYRTDMGEIYRQKQSELLS